jgi:hypothetical protein
MKTLHQLECLKKTHHLILQGNTGTPDKFSKKINSSKRSFFRILNLLKEMDAPICYDKKISTYYYKKDFNLEIHLSIKILSEKETVKIYGRQTFFQKKNRVPSLGTVQTYF